MLLSRTRKRLLHSARNFIFRFGGFQNTLDENEQRDLEMHMGFRGQWDEHRRFQMAFLEEQGLRPDWRVLEIGCGPLTCGLPLIEFLMSDGYTGVDVRSSVLDVAWKQVGKCGLSDKNPRLIRSSKFGDELLGGSRFDLVWSFSVLYHLADDILSACFETVSRRLNADGTFFANINHTVDSSTWLEFPFLRRDVDAYRMLAAQHGLATTDMGSLADLGFRLESLEKDNRLLAFHREG